ncbi:MAG: iron-sulfur cluster-binding domain-containing protein [Gammaproteobacteria bacterium]|nr:iron-sulfur cluster-binding domain-containing protein [Gammaproteobacteria bacterium]
MNKQTSWLDKRRGQVKHWGQALEQRMMAAQWRSASVDMLSFAFEPLWGAKQIPARVDAVEAEEGATHIWLRPSLRWAWPKPGQFVSVSAQHDGEVVTRCYSLSALDAANDRIRLTVCSVNDGLFSNNIAPQLAVGTVLKLSPATGDFVAPKHAAPLWLCAAGSGITPMLPLAEAALAQGQAVRLLAVQREAQPVLWQEWLALQQRYPQLLRCELWCSAEQGRPQIQDFSDRLNALPNNVEVFVCGNSGFRDSLQQAVQNAGLPMAQLHMESFYQTNTAPAVMDSADVVAKVSLSDGREIPVREGETILQAAKSAGVAMTHCCGQGVCRSCETRKVSGVVENLQTGLKQLRDGEWILPCVSLPMGNVELAV